jgi:hypothetical protein
MRPRSKIENAFKGHPSADVLPTSFCENTPVALRPPVPTEQNFMKPQPSQKNKLGAARCDGGKLRPGGSALPVCSGQGNNNI